MVYLLEPCLNFGLEQQAIGRVNRIGQKRKVTVKRLVCKGTIEEGLLQVTSPCLDVSQKPSNWLLTRIAWEVAKRKKALLRGGEEEGSLIEAEIVDMFQLSPEGAASAD